MQKITYEEFLDLTKLDSTSTCGSCQKHKFNSWNNTSSEVNNTLIEIGEFTFAEKSIDINRYNESHPNGTNYWSENAPIALEFYPYHESKILTCKSCHAVFLNYIEDSGHAPQSRLRWVKKDLIYYAG